MLNLVKNYAKNEQSSDELINVLKHEYGIIIDKNLTFNKTDNAKEKVITILKNVFLMVEKVLPVNYANYIYDLQESMKYNPECLLEYLAIETLFQYKYNNCNKVISLKRFCDLSFEDGYGNIDYFANKLYSKFSKSIWKDFCIIDQKGKNENFKTPYFLYPITSKLIRYINKEPYHIKQFNSTNNYAKLLTKTFYNITPEIEKQIEHQKENTSSESNKSKTKQVKNENNDKIRFCISNDEDIINTRCHEIFCYYFLERIYDIDNIIYASRLIKANFKSYTDIVELIYQFHLVPDGKNKKEFISNLIELLYKGNELQLLFHLEPKTPHSLYPTKACEEIFTHNLKACTSYVRFLSNVYYPLISACFYAYCYKNNCFLVLEEYLSDESNGILKSYIKKANKRLTNIENVNYDVKEIFLSIYDKVYNNYFDPESSKQLEALLSVDYSGCNPMTLQKALNAMIYQKSDSTYINNPYSILLDYLDDEYIRNSIDFFHQRNEYP